MERLGDHDAGSHAKNVLGFHERGGAQVGTRPYALEDGGQGDEAGHIAHREAVLTRGNWSHAGAGDGSLKQRDVRRLIGRDEFQIQKEVLAEADINKMLQGEGVESLLVKGVFEMFQLGGVSIIKAAGRAEGHLTVKAN